MKSFWNGYFGGVELVLRSEGRLQSVVRVRDIEIGGRDFVVMAGPCAVETERQVLETAEAVARAGARILRGGAYKPRSSPYSFQGLGLDGLKILKKAREATGLAIVTEVMAETDAAVVAEYADILQIGARSMENYALLEAAGRTGVPVLLKRGMSATLHELLRSAQCVVSTGNHNVILCERGIRAFDKVTRNTLDIAAVPILKAVSYPPVIVDPSHGAGVRALVPVLARAAAVVGADGLLVEVHPQPEKALSDGEQSLTCEQFSSMMHDLKRYLPLRLAGEEAPVTAVAHRQKGESAPPAATRAFVAAAGFGSPH